MFVCKNWKPTWLNGMSDHVIIHYIHSSSWKFVITLSQGCKTLADACVVDLQKASVLLYPHQPRLWIGWCGVKITLNKYLVRDSCIKSWFENIQPKISAATFHNPFENSPPWAAWRINRECAGRVVGFKMLLFFLHSLPTELFSAEPSITHAPYQHLISTLRKVTRVVFRFNLPYVEL